MKRDLAYRNVMLALKCMANTKISSMTATPILNAWEAICKGNFRLLEYQRL